MDKIKINNTYLILPADFVIQFYTESPMFIEEYTPGKWTYGMLVPNDEQGINAKAMGFPNRINVVAALPREYACECYIAGFWKVRAMLMILNATDKEFEISIYYNVALLNPDIKDMTLREFFADELHEILPAPEVRIKFEGFGVGDSFMTFIINNKIYALIPWNTDVNTTLNDIADLVNADTLNNGVTMEVTGDTFDIIQNEPGPKCIIDYGAVEGTESGTFGIALVSETDWLKDYNDDLHAVLISLFDTFYGDSNVCFPIIHNPGFYGYTEGGTADKNPDYKGFLNYTNADGNYLLNFKTGEDHEGNFFGLSPQLFTAFIWDRIWEALKLKVTGDFMLHPDWNKLHFFNNRSLDCIFELQYDTGSILTFYNSFSIADVVPDMTISQFLNSVKSKFCLALIPDAFKNEVLVVQRNNVARKPDFVDYSKIAYLGYPKIKYERTLFGITFHQENDPADQKVINKNYTAQHADYVVGDGSTEYPNAIATVSVDSNITRPDTIIGHIRVPVVDMPGSSLEFEVGINEFTPRLLIYRGQDQDTIAQDYPYSTNDDKDSDGVTIAGALSLLPAALYTNHWKGWAEVIINGIPMRIALYIEPTMLNAIRFDEKYKLLDTLFFIERTQIERKIGSQYLVTFDLMRRSAGKGI